MQTQMDDLVGITKKWRRKDWNSVRHKLKHYNPTTWRAAHNNNSHFQDTASDWQNLVAKHAKESKWFEPSWKWMDQRVKDAVSSGCAALGNVENFYYLEWTQISAELIVKAVWEHDESHAETNAIAIEFSDLIE